MMKDPCLFKLTNDNIKVGENANIVKYPNENIKAYNIMSNDRRSIMAIFDHNSIMVRINLDTEYHDMMTTFLNSLKVTIQSNNYARYINNNIENEIMKKIKYFIFNIDADVDADNIIVGITFNKPNSDDLCVVIELVHVNGSYKITKLWVEKLSRNEKNTTIFYKKIDGYDTKEKITHLENIYKSWNSGILSTGDNYDTIYAHLRDNYTDLIFNKSKKLGVELNGKNALVIGSDIFKTLLYEENVSIGDDILKKYIPLLFNTPIDSYLWETKNRFGFTLYIPTFHDENANCEIYRYRIHAYFKKNSYNISVYECVYDSIDSDEYTYNEILEIEEFIRLNLL